MTKRSTLVLCCLNLFIGMSASIPSAPRYQDSVSVSQESRIDALEVPESIKEIQNHLADHIRLKDYDTRAAFKAIKEAARLADKHFSDLEVLTADEVRLWQECEATLGRAFYAKGRYLEADKHWEKVIEIDATISDPNLSLEFEKDRMKLDSILEDMKFSKTKQWLRDIEPLEKVGDEFDQTNTSLMASMEAKLFRTYAAKGMIESAEKHYQKALSLYERTGNQEGLSRINEEHLVWQQEMNSSLEELEVKEVERVEVDPPSERLLSLREEAEAIENSSVLTGSSALLERYKELQRQIAEEEKLNAIAFLEKENQLENREREILLLEQENELGELSLAQERVKIEEAARKRRNLSLGLALISALALSLFLLYRNKTRSNETLRIAKDDLAMAKDRISALLQEQVSGDIADTLMQGGDIAVQERFVTVMFVDIRDFTPKVAALKPEEIIHYQNGIFGFMIDIIESHHGNINQLLGDGFMATFGAPKSFGDDTQNAVDAGIKILKALEQINSEGSMPHTEIGIGIDCGMAVMGNVGNESRKQFSITGNVVISAARIEQANKGIGSHFLISKEVRDTTEIAHQMTSHSVPLKGRKGDRSLYQVLVA